MFIGVWEWLLFHSENLYCPCTFYSVGCRSLGFDRGKWMLERGEWIHELVENYNCNDNSKLLSPTVQNLCPMHPFVQVFKYMLSEIFNLILLMKLEIKNQQHFNIYKKSTSQYIYVLCKWSKNLSQVDFFDFFSLKYLFGCWSKREEFSW